MKITLYKLTAMAVLVVLLASCSLLEPDPKIISSDTYYSNQKEVTYGLAGVYGAITSESFYGNNYSLMCSNIDDLCYYNNSSNTAYIQYNRHNASTAEIYDMWYIIYKGINNANDFIEAMEDNKYDEEGRYSNEARFLRAYYHFVLAQAWGDVPLRDKAVKTYAETSSAASSQYEVLDWSIKEMESCAEFYKNLYLENPEYEIEDLNEAPSRVCKNTIHGILARAYLFMAGETVKRPSEITATACYAKAKEHAWKVIESGKHFLNPDYSQVFINMISDQYDYEYRESMWEADFLGDRSTAELYSNGKIGQILGLKSGTNSSNYSEFNCNYAYGRYNGSLQLWDLYWTADRTDDEASTKTITDKRHEWNLPPYNYEGDGVNKKYFNYGGTSSKDDPTAAQGVRNCGKFRREVQYEGQKHSKRMYTTINFPILRYSDILLMYAEASCEVEGVTQTAYECVKAVRDRAGIKTKEFAAYCGEGTDSFRDLVRNERGRELCFESLRKYDLIRWGIYKEEMNEYVELTKDARWIKKVGGKDYASYASAMGGAVQEKHIVLPVPSIELGVNKLLHQHPLW